MPGMLCIKEGKVSGNWKENLGWELSKETSRAHLQESDGNCVCVCTNPRMDTIHECKPWFACCILPGLKLSVVWLICVDKTPRVNKAQLANSSWNLYWSFIPGEFTPSQTSPQYSSASHTDRLYLYHRECHYVSAHAVFILELQVTFPGHGKPWRKRPSLWTWFKICESNSESGGQDWSAEGSLNCQWYTLYLLEFAKCWRLHAQVYHTGSLAMW